MTETAPANGNWKRDLPLKLALAACFVTVAMPLLGLVLITSGSARDGGSTVQAALMPLNVLVSTAPLSVIAPIASLLWLNLLLLGRAKAQSLVGASRT